MGDQRACVGLADCDFYHTSALRSGEVVRGAWDLRRSESAYLGDQGFAGQRVLELGPASGHLTFWMEDQGAEVVSFDAGWDVSVDLLPQPGVDHLRQRADFMTWLGRVQNAWWYLHRDHASRAKIAYGNIYALPGDLGTFDTSVLAAILLHLRDPFSALAQAAARTTRRIIVTESVQDPTVNPDDHLMRWASAEFNNLSVWWTITPRAVERMLIHLGFEKITRTGHAHKHYVGHDLSKEPVDMEMFSVIGER